MERVNITIIGAGVIGLGIAAELSGSHKDIIIVERNPSFGAETSSRNSEVIHAGIYYPKDSLKLRTCLEGRELIYRFCVSNKVRHKKTGKLIVAVDRSEIMDLEKLFQRGRENGVGDLRMLSKAEVGSMEPHISVEAAIYSPSTGILDTHQFMKSLALSFEGSGGQIAYNTEVTAINRSKAGYDVTVKSGGDEEFTFNSGIVINCAGLYSDRISAMAGIDRPEYKLKYCKGDYFRLSLSKSALIGHLIYPVPKERGAGLGIHATPDLAGSVRLGPDDKYVENIDYNVDASRAGAFQASVNKFLPFVDRADIVPDTSGVRPKLQGPGEAFRDFVISHEEDKGLPGFINLIGIESPGFTASLAIAGMVANIVKGVRPHSGSDPFCR